MSGLRFLYRVTIPKSWHIKMIPSGKRPKKLPEVLGSQEVDSLLSNVKFGYGLHRACPCFSSGYGECIGRVDRKGLASSKLLCGTILGG